MSGLSEEEREERRAWGDWICKALFEKLVADAPAELLRTPLGWGGLLSTVSGLTDLLQRYEEGEPGVTQAQIIAQGRTIRDAWRRAARELEAEHG